MKFYKRIRTHIRRGERGCVGLGGLYGRPRPVLLARILENTITPHPAGDHKGPPNPTSSTLAPTEYICMKS